MAKARGLPGRFRGELLEGSGASGGVLRDGISELLTVARQRQLGNEVVTDADKRVGGLQGCGFSRASEV